MQTCNFWEPIIKKEANCHGITNQNKRKLSAHILNTKYMYY